MAKASLPHQPAGSSAPVPVFGLGHRWPVLAVVAVASLSTSLTTTALNTIIPVIQNAFQVPLSTVQWVAMVYSLALSSLLLTGGRLGDMVGHRRVYTIGLTVMAAGGGLAIVAPTAGLLVVARALQGIGASMATAMASAILTLSFPAQQRGQVLGAMATVTYIGVTVGPVIGGILAETLGWRSIFVPTLFLSGAAALASLWVIPAGQHSGQKKFDFMGASLLSACLLALLYGMSKGSEWGWGRPTLAVLGVGVICGVGFLAVEKRVRHPLISLALFRNRVFALGTASAVLNYVSVFIIFFLLPFYLVQVRGVPLSQVGLVLAAKSLVMAALAPFSGALSDRIGSRLPASCGMLFLAVGLFGLSRVTVTSPIWWVAACLMVQGVGVGLFTSPNNSAIMGAAPREHQGVAGGVAHTARNTGMVFGIALAGTIYAQQLLALKGAGLAAPEASVAAFRTAMLVATATALVGAWLSFLRGSAPKGKDRRV